MKPTLKVPTHIHSKIMAELLALPADAIVAGLLKLNAGQWQDILEGSSVTSKQTVMSVHRLRAIIEELRAHIIAQVNVEGVE